MREELAPEQIKNYKPLILDAFGGKKNLHNRIVEVIRSGKKIDYSPGFARAVAEPFSVPDNIPVIELMKVIQEVYPPLEEDYQRDEKKQEGIITGDVPTVKPWMIKSAQRYQNNEAKKRGLTPEEYEEYNNV